jgi:N utilization substance protein B
LVEGVVEHRERIDKLIESHSVGWSLNRMPLVDRNLLRIGAFELLWVDETPDGVVLSEAVNLAQQLSTDESAAFVNGVLAKLLAEKPTLAV